MGYLYTFYPGEPVPERKINLDFTEARDSELQWHQLDHMQVCTSLKTDNHAGVAHSALRLAVTQFPNTSLNDPPSSAS